MPNQRKSARRPVRRRPRRQNENHTDIAGKLLIMAAVVAAIILGVAIFFRVSKVEIQGNKIYSAEQVAEVSGIETGDNLLMVNKSAVNGRIQARLPYVQSSSIARILPDTIVIKVVESEIAGLVRSDVGSKWYINTKGRVLGSSVDGFTGQVIELEGFTITAPQAGQDSVASEGQEENLEAALTVLQELEGTGLIELVTAVNTEKTYDIQLLCGEQYEVLLGGTEEMDYKIWYLQETLQQLDPYQTGTLDLTFDQKRVARFLPWE